MKNIICLIVLAFTFLAAGHQTAIAQEKRLNSSPPSFRAFFAKFKAAVEKNDKTAVAAMTSFPFSYGFDAGNEGSMSKSQFIKRFAEIFGKSPKRFLPEKNPLFSRDDRNSYVISTNEAASFMFEKKGNTFKFTAYMVEP